MKHKVIFLIFLVFAGCGLFAQTADLRLDLSDLWIVPRGNGATVTGYDLYVNQRGDIQSVLLIDRETKLGFRSKEFDPVNGNETRLYDEKNLTFTDGSYNITSSSPQLRTRLGSKSFQLYLPLEMVYGYTPRNTVRLTGIDTITIRAYNEKYNNPQAQYKDSSFRLDQLLAEASAPMPVIAELSSTIMELREPPADAYEKGTGYSSVPRPEPVYDRPQTSVPAQEAVSAPVPSNPFLYPYGITDNELTTIIRSTDKELESVKKALHNYITNKGLKIDKLNYTDEQIIKIINRYK